MFDLDQEHLSRHLNLVNFQASIHQFGNRPKEVDEAHFVVLLKTARHHLFEIAFLFNVARFLLLVAFEVGEVHQVKESVLIRHQVLDLLLKNVLWVFVIFERSFHQGVLESVLAEVDQRIVFYVRADHVGLHDMMQGVTRFKRGDQSEVAVLTFEQLAQLHWNLALHHQVRVRPNNGCENELVNSHSPFEGHERNLVA